MLLDWAAWIYPKGGSLHVKNEKNTHHFEIQSHDLSNPKGKAHPGFLFAGPAQAHSRPWHNGLDSALFLACMQGRLITPNLLAQKPNGLGLALYVCLKTHLDLRFMP